MRNCVTLRTKLNFVKYNFDIKLRDRFIGAVFANHNPSARSIASLTEPAKRMKKKLCSAHLKETINTHLHYSPQYSEHIFLNFLLHQTFCWQTWLLKSLTMTTFPEEFSVTVVDSNLMFLF